MSFSIVFGKIARGLKALRGLPQTPDPGTRNACRKNTGMDAAGNLRRFREPFHHEISDRERNVVDGDLVTLVTCNGAFAYVEHKVHPLETGLYRLTDNDEWIKLNESLVPQLSDPLPRKGRRRPHVRVTSLAHAAYSLLIDALKAFIRDNLHEPTRIHLDLAAEMVLQQYAKEAQLIDKRDVLRARVDKLLGCEIIWDAKSFRFSSGEEMPDEYVRGRNAFSAPFATLPPEKKLEEPLITKTPVRPIDNIDTDGAMLPVPKSEVTEGQSISQATSEKIAKSVGRFVTPVPRKFL